MLTRSIPFKALLPSSFVWVKNSVCRIVGYIFTWDWAMKFELNQQALVTAVTASFTWCTAWHWGWFEPVVEARIPSSKWCRTSPPTSRSTQTGCTSCSSNGRRRRCCCEQDGRPDWRRPASSSGTGAPPRPPAEWQDDERRTTTTSEAWRSRRRRDSKVDRPAASPRTPSSRTGAGSWRLREDMSRWRRWCRRFWKKNPKYLTRLYTLVRNKAAKVADGGATDPRY